MVSSGHFRQELRAQLTRAYAQGWKHILIRGGELHRMLGGYPGSRHGLEACCEAMQAEMQPGDVLLENGGLDLAIRYRLPRNSCPPPNPAHTD
jgi:5-methylcytosine-specific restriction protein A